MIESPETIRETVLTEDIVRTTWRHVEVASQQPACKIIGHKSNRLIGEEVKSAS